MGPQAVWKIFLPTGALNRDLKLICVSNFFGAFGDGLFVYVLPIYIRGLEATATDVGLLYSLLTLSTALTIIPGGFVADKFDRKKVMIFGWLIWVPLPLIISAAKDWSQLMLPMILYGVFLSGAATNAYVATSASEETMTLTFAMVSASWSSGYICSPALGGYLATTIGMRWVFFFTFILYSIATSLIFFIGSQHAAKPKISPKTFSNNAPSKAGKMILLSLFFAITMFFLMLVRPLVAQFLQEVFSFGTLYIGFFGSLISLGWTLFAIWLGKIGDKWGKMVAIATSLLINSLSFWLLISFNNFFLLILASFLNGASYPVWYLMNASIGAIAPKGYRGRWISLAQVTAMLPAFIAPYLGGMLYKTSPYVPFHLVIVVTLLLAALALYKSIQRN